jgi:uncharacterized repeat protein (TIGR01451 family)
MEDYASAPRRSEQPRHSRRACAVMMAATLLCGASLASAAIDKNATYQEMLGLAQQMKSLKPQIRTNAQAAAAYTTAADRYRSLSASMGGDDPGHVGGGAAAAAARHRAPRRGVVTPAGCGQTTATFSNSTPVAIPSGPAVVTSTIVVSGAGPYLFDVNALTHIQHTFSADLDITLTSPAGTVVTLTTDNGAGNDDVFNGTVWDDSANPGGQVPYTTNNGLVTDQAYTNLTVATPLVPEEAMGAFIGEDPNGTWTLTISDDLAGDGGSLNDWSLDITTFPNAPITTTVPTATQSTPVAIPSGPAVVTSTIVISGAGTSILDVNALTHIQHTFAADLDITLTSPAGTVVTLTTDNGAGNDDVFNGTLWDDSANPGGQVPYTTNNGLVTDNAYVNLTTATPLVPEEAMAAFIGEDPNGTWTLTISDDLAGDGGSLNDWSLDIKTFSCASSDLSITKTDGVTTVAPGGTTTYTITASNAGPTAANPATVTDTFPAACTSVTYTSTAAGGATGNTATGSGNINDAALNLPAGSSVVYTATCTLSPGASGTLVNTATVASASPDPNSANNSATDTDTFSAASADLSLTKTLTTPAPIHVGDNVVFALTVTNNGPANATGVTVTDILPAGLAYVSNDCGAGFATPTLTWNVGALAVTGSATCHLTATVTQTGTITNTASATGNESDPTPANNAGQAPIAGQPAAIIPTLDSVGLAALAILLAVSAAFALRRKRRV